MQKIIEIDYTKKHSIVNINTILTSNPYTIM